MTCKIWYYLYEMIRIREFEHLPRQNPHYAVKLVGRSHGHDTAAKKNSSLKFK